MILVQQRVKYCWRLVFVVCFALHGTVLCLDEFVEDNDTVEVVDESIEPAVDLEERLDEMSKTEVDEQLSTVVNATEKHTADNDEDAKSDDGPKIRSIIIEGNKNVSDGAILNCIPYQVGERFRKAKTNKLITNVYDLGYFRQVEVFKEPLDDGTINLVVILTEREPLSGVTFEGNKHLSEKEIKKKVDFSKIPAIDKYDIPKYERLFEKMYKDKNYHDARVKGEMSIVDGKAQVAFTVDEGKRALIKHVRFVGNKSFTAKKLRSLIFSREDWIMGAMDKSGTYQPEMLKGDKFIIESFYQSHGFLHAKVTETKVDREGHPDYIDITFEIEEGDLYVVNEVHCPGNELFSEDELLARMILRPGQLYSREVIKDTIEGLQILHGEFGYIHADIEPSIQPDDEKKTVAITFYVELGPKVQLHRVNIRGNKKTHDMVVRRNLQGLQEGTTLTTKSMEDAKLKVENLGYFDPRAGVNWKTHRVGEDGVELDLILKEVKTGRFEGKLGVGGSPKDISSPKDSISAGITISETNLFGRGLHTNLSGEFSKEEQTFNFNLTEPWLFDKPINASFDAYHKRSKYDEFKLINESEIKEKITGGAVGLGFLVPIINDVLVIGKIGAEQVTYKDIPTAKNSLTQAENAELQKIFDRRFISGNFLHLSGIVRQDFRNHPMHPSRGYQWSLESKCTLHSTPKGPADTDKKTKKIGFVKFDADASWYTPLIGERDLVLCLHGHFGLILPFKKKSVPFRELFNIGGPASVRGFLFGDIGPHWRSTSGQKEAETLGGKKALWFNTELVFPITKDFSMKGAIFYDGGAGWDTPDKHLITKKYLTQNTFDYRHSIGFGLRVLNPTPMKIDWGFKLDRRKGESAHEVHFSMYHEF